MSIQSVSTLLVLSGALGLLGCASTAQSRRVNAPPPPAPTTPAGTVPAQHQPTVATVVVPGSRDSVVVFNAPPAPHPEAVSPQPSSDNVWIPGHWTWQNNNYAWMGGHWALPPVNNAVWVGPRWEPEGSTFRFHEGYWSN
jgi:hypothetical protein